MYHISDIKKFTTCPRLYYLSQDDDASFIAYIRSDNLLKEHLIEYFNISDIFVGEKNDPVSRFLDNQAKYEWFYNTRFEENGLRIKIPLLHKVDGQYDLYFVLYKTNDKDLDLNYYRIIINVIRSFNININQVYIIYFNINYIFNNKLDVKELFIVSNIIKDEEIIDLIDNDDFNYLKVIDSIKNGSLADYEIKMNKYCRLHNGCSFYDICFKEEKELPDDNVLTLVSSEYKNDLYERGIIYLKDIDSDLIEGNKVQYAQIMASKNRGRYVDKHALKTWLESFASDTISFIDFEWDRYLIPPYNKMHPFDVLCFEFSLYYIEKGELKHKTFVGKGDCRKDFIEQLINTLPNSGPILAYNASGAECLRLIELSEAFIEYKDQLLDIVSRFVDLAYPFVEGVVYDIKMRGNFSVKKLIEIVSDKTYDDLEVEDGLSAVIKWRELDLGNCENEDKVIKDLDTYCSLDAYSLILIYKWLLSLAI